MGLRANQLPELPTRGEDEKEPTDFFSVGSNGSPDDTVGNTSGLHSGRGGTRTHDLTDVNRAL